MKIQRILSHNKCLLLNADYSILEIVDWKRSILWGVKRINSIDIISFYQTDYIRGANKIYPLPAVAKTKKYYQLSNYFANFNRKNVFIRDNYSCQYCNKKFTEHELTYDHVIPKSIWKFKISPTNWTNIVTCCKKCNKIKSDKTPQQANMILKKSPIRPVRNPKFLPAIQTLSNIDKDSIPDEWKIYLEINIYEYCKSYLV
jgi:5-methylcytosine-specific restriction endonuclease McrA